MRYECQIIEYRDGAGYSVKLSKPSPAGAVGGTDRENEKDLVDLLKEMRINEEGIADIRRQLDAMGHTDIFSVQLSDEDIERLFDGSASRKNG